MKQHLSKILTKRRELISDWTKINLLGQGDIPYLSLTLLDCGHFAIPDTRYSCLLCRFKIKLLHYESLISGETVDCVTNDVTTMKSMTENALKVIYEFAKKNQFDPTLLEAGRLHILQFCDLQNEIFVRENKFFRIHQLSHLQHFHFCSTFGNGITDSMTTMLH